ncbi:MAG TPA: secretin N-terminal domain-containing protein, partial [Opitutales bacterium]|nr:secretin N-terminal domain-containing protein [Opitutales bacterium]
MVQPFLSPGLSSIVPFPNTHTLMITDTALNLQRVEDILGKIDQPISMREEVLFYTLKNISASELQKRFDQMREKSLKPYLQGNTWFEADDRSNQLIVITHPANIPVIQHFIDNLDIDATPLTRSEVFMVRHGEAPKIVEVLQKLIDSQKASLKDRQERNGKRPDIEKSDKGGAGINQQNAENSLEFSDYLTLSPDERTNAIVVCGTRSDIKQIGRLIDELDSLLPQVRIEVVISEVLLNDTLNRGIEAFGVLYDNTGTSNNPGAGNVGKNLTFTETGLGSTYSLITSVMSFKLDSVFTTAETNQNVRILSAPTIVTTHNKEAQIKVVQQYPIITQTITNTASTADNAVNNSITYKDIGITLTVTPKIGTNGVIQMEIDQILSDTSSSVTISGVSQPIVASREAKSYIS